MDEFYKCKIEWEKQIAKENTQHTIYVKSENKHRAIQSSVGCWSPSRVRRGPSQGAAGLPMEVRSESIWQVSEHLCEWGVAGNCYT